MRQQAVTPLTRSHGHGEWPNNLSSHLLSESDLMGRLKPASARWRLAFQIIAHILFICLCGNAAMFAVYESNYDQSVGLGFFIFLTPLFAWFTFLALRPDKSRAPSADNVPCPECGYNLRGLTQARCPECGGEFTLEQLIDKE